MLTSVPERLDEPAPQLNTTPLIDVMLMLTLPVMTRSVRLDSAIGTQHETIPPPVAVIEIDYDGSIC